jgi:thioredoxin
MIQNNMKIQLAILILPAALLLGSCGNQSQSGAISESSKFGGNGLMTEVAAAESSTDAVKQGTMMLSKEDFLAKVMNYEKNTTEWVFEGDRPCLIDFYADWCGPCRTAAPILEEMAAEYAGKIDIYKIDTEKERELASLFGISGIPAFLYVPVEGRPTMTQGIGRTIEETRQMFRENIESLLLI